jgi:hypothetical protein
MKLIAVHIFNLQVIYCKSNLPELFHTDIGWSNVCFGQQISAATETSTDELDDKSYCKWHSSIVLQRFLYAVSSHDFTVYNISHFQVLIIAHRLEMILMADRIVLLEGSEVREMTRSAFLSRDGHFSQPDALSTELGEIWFYEGKVVCMSCLW